MFKMWRRLLRRIAYQRLRDEYEDEGFDAVLEEKVSTSVILNVDTTKNKASDADINVYWQRADRPLNRKRRRAMTEEQLKEDFVELKSMIYIQNLKDLGLM